MMQTIYSGSQPAVGLADTASKWLYPHTQYISPLFLSLCLCLALSIDRCVYVCVYILEDSSSSRLKYFPSISYSAHFQVHDFISGLLQEWLTCFNAHKTRQFSHTVQSSSPSLFTRTPEPSPLAAFLRSAPSCFRLRVGFSSVVNTGNTFMQTCDTPMQRDVKKSPN